MNLKAKDLRNSILQQAVEGKLVDQDPADEPASALLDRIRTERRKLVQEGKLKYPKGGESVIFAGADGHYYETHIDKKGHSSEPACIDNEIPFEIPSSWGWARLEDICKAIVDCPHSTPQYLTVKTGYTAIDTNCIDDKWQLTMLRNLSKDSYEKRVRNYVPCIGDIVFSREGSIGKSIILNQQNVCLGQRVMLMSTLPQVLLNRYCLIVLSSPYAWSLYSAANIGTGVKHINVSMVKNLLVPLPPIAEQHRIVEKTERLMPLVNDYEILADNRNKLDEILLKRLRNSILQQAVEGKLVDQDPADEPASALLDRIRTERRKLVQEGKLKYPKGGESVIFAGADGHYYETHIDKKGHSSEPACIDNEIPFEIPSSWGWTRLENIADLKSGLGYRKSDLEFRSPRMIRVLRGGNIGDSCAPVIKDTDIFISDRFVDENLILRDGQIITPAVTSLENVGKSALIENTDGKTVCGGFVFFLTPLFSSDVFSQYLYCYLTSPSHISFCKDSVKKSGQAFYNLSKSVLNTAMIAIPPLAEQRRICQRVHELFNLF
jgi:type I restriction enzyme S subunit